MTLLPIIERELRARARSRGTYRTRLAVGLTGALLCVQQLIVTGPLNTPAETGRLVFNEMAGAAFALCCGACLLAAEAINSERREGTLGLLFLTRVRSFDVLAGKLVSVGATSLCALVGLVPALVLPVLAGGVSVE
jgi:ABC-type transport system involved in multi-copper enzyme maturation permease subunit